MIGGSSAVNAAVAIRARPADFARWAGRGIQGWSWEEAFAAYKALANTPTGDDGWHGRSGPFPVRQRTAAENTPSMRAFVNAPQAVGLNLVNGEYIAAGEIILSAGALGSPAILMRSGIGPADHLAHTHK